MTRAGVDGSVRSTTPPLEPDVPRWIQLPVRVLAVLVVVPLRLLWEAVRLTGRFLHRYLIRPLLGRARHRRQVRVVAGGGGDC